MPLLIKRLQKHDTFFDKIFIITKITIVVKINIRIRHAVLMRNDKKTYVYNFNACVKVTYREK